MIIVSDQERRQREIARTLAEAAKLMVVEGPEGGRYLVGSRLGDCNGEPSEDYEGS